MVDYVPMHQCRSNEYWEKRVKGSNNNYYTVSFQKQYNGDYDYDYECTCPAFKHRAGYCKHIKSNMADRCDWHEQWDSHSTSDNKCPKCGGDVMVVMCAV
jgi:uncharacterized Zn finger protein